MGDEVIGCDWILWVMILLKDLFVWVMISQMDPDFGFRLLLNYCGVRFRVLRDLIWVYLSEDIRS